MKKCWKLVPVCILLAGLAGCRGELGALPYARELEDMALMRTMGVDAGAAGGVTVTVSTGSEDRGGSESGSSPTILRKDSGTISGACLAMQGEGAAYIFYGHVGQLLLGEALARTGIAEALDYVFRDVEMRLDTELYLVREATAEAAIRAAAETSSAADRLEAMEADAGLLSDSMARTVKEVMGELEENGCSFAPALAVSEEDGGLAAAGYGLIRGDRVAGWAAGEAARGVNLLEGRVDADILELQVPGGGRAAVRIVGAGTRVEPVFDGDRLTGLRVCCGTDANLAEGSPSVDLNDAALRAWMEDALARRTEERLRAALELCRQLDGDFFQLQNRAGQSAPWRWRELREQWDLASLDIDVKAEGHILRGYDVRG